MNWRRVPLSEHMTGAARILSEGEVVIEFSPTVRGWFGIAVFDDLRATENAERYFARAIDRDGPTVQAVATGCGVPPALGPITPLIGPGTPSA